MGFFGFYAGIFKPHVFRKKSVILIVLIALALIVFCFQYSSTLTSEVELRKEIKTIGSSEMILQRTLEQVDEIMRELRAALFLLDRDLEDKLKVLNIERDCLNLKTTDLNLSTYHGTRPLNVS